MFLKLKLEGLYFLGLTAERKTKMIASRILRLMMLSGLALLGIAVTWTAEAQNQKTQRQANLDPSHLVGIYAPPDSMAARDNILNFKIPPDIDIEMVIDQVLAEPPDTFIWRGYLPDKPGSQVTLIAEKFIFSGFFQLDTGSFEIRYLDRRRPKPGARATNFVYPLKPGAGFEIILPPADKEVVAPPGIASGKPVEVYIVLQGVDVPWDDLSARQAIISDLQDGVIAVAGEHGLVVTQRFTHLPILVAELTESAFEILSNLPEVQSISKLPPLEEVEGLDLGPSPADLPVSTEH